MHTIRHRIRAILHGVAGLAAGVASVAAAAPQVTVSVRYAKPGPDVTVASDPDLAFRCTSSRTAVVCSARVPRGTALTLRARTRAPAGASSVSAMSLPIDGPAWGGACAGTPADACHLRATRPLAIRIDTRDQ